ncbi:MAG: NAD(P)-binding protein [Candidatus Alcyoniella australis]|nr:NAD(P)-binding protein [Candidatus Alcyoniella australis]
MEHKPLIFNTLAEIPELVVSLATMEHNATGSWRYLRPSFQNKVPPCNNGCPAGNDIEGFIRLIGERRFLDAWVRLKQENPLTRTCGRVCFHPCEGKCNRREHDQALSIQALERFAGEHAQRSALPGVVRPSSGKRVAIVGAGPAGLSAAFHLARMGHAVTLLEKHDKPGGILRYGIPAYRLPREVLDDEIEDILSLGVELRCGVRVGQGGDVGFDELADYDALFIAVGAHSSRSLGIPGENAARVIPGLELLRRIGAGEQPDVGSRAVVIGGGNTALDAARSLLRHGARADVYYRRSRAEMPAFEDEIEEAVREGVGLYMLEGPVRIELDDEGNVRGLTMMRMRLGAPDASGRRRPEPIEGSEHHIEADTVIAAIGETVDSSSLPPGLQTEDDGSLQVDEFGRCSQGGMLAGGDVTPILRTVVTAVGSGKLAAIAIDMRLAGEPPDKVEQLMRIGQGGSISISRYLDSGEAHAAYDDANTVVQFEQINTAYFPHLERGQSAHSPMPQRIKDFSEVNAGLDEAAAMREVERCFHCGLCTECDNCYIFCPDVAVIPREGEFGYDVNYDYCKGCGICASECPRSCIILTED